MTKDEARTAIKEALANHIEDNLAMVAPPTSRDYAMGYAEGFNDGCKPKPEQGEPFGYFKAEPFGWTDCAETDEGAIALYEMPPQRTWVGLTDKVTSQTLEAYEQDYNWFGFAKAIEAKLRELNA